MSNIEKQISDAINQEPIAFFINIQYSGFKKFLNGFKLLKKLLPDKREFAIHPATISTLLKMAPELRKITIDLSNVNDEQISSAYLTIADNAIPAVKAITYAITKGKKDEEIEQFLLDHLTGKSLTQLFHVIIAQSDITFFLSTLKLMGKMNVMETDMNQTNQTSLEQLDQFLNTTKEA